MMSKGATQKLVLIKHQLECLQEQDHQALSTKLTQLLLRKKLRQFTKYNYLELSTVISDYGCYLVIFNKYISLK